MKSVHGQFGQETISPVAQVGSMSSSGGVCVCSRGGRQRAWCGHTSSGGGKSTGESGRLSASGNMACASEGGGESSSEQAGNSGAGGEGGAGGAGAAARRGLRPRSGSTDEALQYPHAMERLYQTCTVCTHTSLSFLLPLAPSATLPPHSSHGSVDRQVHS